MRAAILTKILEAHVRTLLTDAWGMKFPIPENKWPIAIQAYRDLLKFLNAAKLGSDYEGPIGKSGEKEPARQLFHNRGDKSVAKAPILRDQAWQSGPRTTEHASR
jgi:hypothetical protein